MRRLVHISDLHFGRDRPELLEPLREAINKLGADLVVISGDLTQRATVVQFKAAAAFISALAPPVLAIPGNHDLPLHNLIMRVFTPWRRYRKWISADLNPKFVDDELVVVGVNTVNRFAWQQGWLRSRALRRISAEFSSSGKDRTCIVVVHHPLEHQPGERKTLMRNAALGVQVLSDCGADVVLSGHLHSWRADPFAIVAGRMSALQVHAGTSLSNRLRGEVNDFNLLEIEKGRITIRHHVFSDETSSFTTAASVTFDAGPQGWQRNLAT
ncbi:MAG: metallophosphoesterase [Cypionkella sp.]|uniref:metallophosphoesterase family protein n=1 Tax=Cypionkella sp. TaxID=2811411 RepID=UPI0026081E02|nr:metallophosphoesterase [Cypionkella sp.]MDB5660135.1 metallophosphoesterase [Cypionkella sp.]